MEVAVDMWYLNILFGFFVGIASGLLGIGGGGLLVTLLRVAGGMPAIECTATALFTVIPTSVSGVVTHARHKTSCVSLGVLMGCGGACSAPVGVLLATHSPDWFIMTTAALVIGLSAVKMFQKAAVLSRERKRAKRLDASQGTNTACVGAAAGADASPCTAPIPHASSIDEHASSAALHCRPQHRRFSVRTVVIALVIGLIAGLASGYVGVGGGFVMVPLMIAFLNIKPSLASGTSLVAVMILAVPGVITQFVLGNVNVLVGVLLALGSIPGAVVGARLVTILPERMISLLFGIFLLLSAVGLVVRELLV